MISKPLSASSDTLASKSSQELLILFSQLVEQYASVDLVLTKVAYSVTFVPDSPNQLAIRDVTEKKVRWVDFSRIKVGKNVRLKDYRKGRFTLIFSKEVAKIGEKRRPKRFELFFLVEKRKQTTDYKKLQALTLELLKQLEAKM